MVEGQQKERGMKGREEERGREKKGKGVLKREKRNSDICQKGGEGKKNHGVQCIGTGGKERLEY